MPLGAATTPRRDLEKSRKGKGKKKEEMEVKKKEKEEKEDEEEDDDDDNDNGKNKEEVEEETTSQALGSIRFIILCICFSFLLSFYYSSSFYLSKLQAVLIPIFLAFLPLNGTLSYLGLPY